MHMHMHMCARAHPPPYCPPTLQFGGFAPNVIIGEPDGSDSAPSNDIVCNGRSRGGVVAQTVTAGQTFGVPPLCAPRQQAPPKLLPHPASSGPKHRTRLPSASLDLATTVRHNAAQSSRSPWRRRTRAIVDSTFRTMATT